MQARNALFGLSVVLGLFFLSIASAQTVTNGPSAAEARRMQTSIIYVGDFTPNEPTPGSEPGLFQRMKAKHDDKKIDANAQNLAEAVVKALCAKGVVAYRASPSQSLPMSGWLVQGSYQQTISHNPFPLISSLIQPSHPNTDASISITDLGAASAGQVAQFSTSGTLKGQSSSFSTNPYKIVAHVVIHRVEASTSMNDLANAIADRIVAMDVRARAMASGASNTLAQLP